MAQQDIDHLKQSTGITDAQLNHRIDYSRDEDKLWTIAGFLDSYDFYVGRPGFDLKKIDIADLRDCAWKRNNQYAMKMAFNKWVNGTHADKPITYRSLVDILIELDQRIDAEKVCRTCELFRAS